MLWFECLCLCKSHVKTLSPQNDDIRRGRAFEKCLSHEGGALMNEINVLMKEIPQNSTVPSTVWGHREEAPVRNRKRALTKTWPCYYWYRLPAFTTVRNFFFISYPIYGIWSQQLKWTKTHNEINHTTLIKIIIVLNF